MGDTMAFQKNDLDLMALRTSDLKSFFKFIYKCSKCGYKYGNDLEEKPRQVRLCPICEEAFTNRKRFV